MLLIFIVLSVTEVVRHWYIINHLHRSPNKVLSFLLRAGVALMFLLAPSEQVPIYISGFTYLITDWYIHDYVLNLIRGVKPVWYLNSTGPFDKFQNAHPNALTWFVMKTIMLIIFVNLYLLT